MKTYTVETCFQGRDKQWRVYVRGLPAKSLLTDEPLAEGTAIRVVDGKAVRS